MELSLEEKKAIENFKEIIENLDEDEQIEYEEEIQDYKTLLNLIDDQKKEIEEKTTILLAGAEKVKQLEKEIEKKNCLINVLQHRIEELLDNKKEINYIKPIDIPVHNYISKDKIREKLKELEEQFKKYENEGLSGFVSKIDKGTRIEVLKELLEED